MNNFNKYITHPLQSYEWGVFREKTGLKVIRSKNFQVTIHKIPHTPWTIGYIPKGALPNKKMLEELLCIGKDNKCIFIQIEPDVRKNHKSRFMIHDSKFMILPSAHPLFTKYTLILDLTKSEEELLAAMHPKTRYNIRVAQKYGVKIVEDNSDEAFETYLQLMEETTKRQKFYAHTKKYHRLMWETLKATNQQSPITKLTAHLFLGKYQPANHQSPITLTAWMLFTFKDTLYYPYGASSREHKEVMAQNLMMWEAIQFGKKLGLKKFDMWGSLGSHPNKKDPWYGFHRFKLGYNPMLAEFIGSYDLVITPVLYQWYRFINKLRWFLLKLRKYYYFCFIV